MTATPARVEIPYPHRLAGHCASGSYRDLLEFHALSWTEEPLSEGMCFGLGGGVGLAFVELPDMSTPIYMVGRTAGLETDICDNLGIGLEQRQTDDPDEGWAILRSELDAGRPTMVWADIGELEYLRVRLRMSMHDIVVCGYDEAEGIALVADNDRDEIQRCSLESLARARNSSSFPARNRHMTFVMRFPEELPEPAAPIRRGVEIAAGNMRSGGQSLKIGRAPLGLVAADAFAASYPHWPERFGDKLGAALSGLRAFIVKAGTGGALFRSLQAEFLRDSGELLADPALTAAGELYEELARRWVELAETVESGEPETHAAGVPLVAPLVALEREAVDAMDTWLASSS